MAFTQATMTQAAANPSRNLVFFRSGSGKCICYNYKTQQWTAIPAYDSTGLFSVRYDTRIIGLVRFSAGSVNLQAQTTSHVPQAAKFITGAPDINQYGRVVVNGVRPLVNGGTWSTRVGVQDTISGAVSWSTLTSVNSRSGMANFRSEGRYVRAELTNSDGFTTAMGIDIDVAPQGKV